MQGAWFLGKNNASVSFMCLEGGSLSLWSKDWAAQTSELLVGFYVSEEAAQETSDVEFLMNLLVSSLESIFHSYLCKFLKDYILTTVLFFQR